MDQDWDVLVSALLSAHEGHFVLESGHHGRLWLDVDAAFWRPTAVDPLAQELARRLERYEPAGVCGPLVGGALLAYLVARRLDATFVQTERRAHERGQLFSARYELPQS